MNFYTLVIFSVFSIARASDLQWEFQLGGRDASIRIQRVDEKLSCGVSFLPIKAFGASKNQELNGSKARLYCIKGLVIWSGATKGQSVEISGLKEDSPGRIEGNMYSQVYEVPISGVRLDGRDSSNVKTAPVVLNSDGEEQITIRACQKSGLLSRAVDYTEIIDQIAHDLGKSIDTSPLPFLDVWVADREDEIFKLFSACLREVVSDELLLKVEKSELKNHIIVKREALIVLLREKYTTELKKSKKLDADSEHVLEDNSSLAN